MEPGRQFTDGHGSNLDFDAHIANGSLRIAKTPVGHAYRMVKGKRVDIKDSPDIYSWVTPENDAESWPEGTKEHYDRAREVFPEAQNRKDFQDKLGQIKRSCPICREMR